MHPHHFVCRMVQNICAKKNINDVGFIDPLLVNSEHCMQNPKTVEAHLLKCLKHQHYKSNIALAYNMKG